VPLWRARARAARWPPTPCTEALAEEQEAQRVKQQVGATKSFEQRETTGVTVTLAKKTREHDEGVAKRFTSRGIGDGVLADYQAAPKHLEPVPKTPGSPVSCQPLRFKHDVFAVDLEKEKETGAFICAVSKRRLLNQPVVAITPSRKVMLKDVYQELALPSMTCPVTGMGFTKADVIELVWSQHKAARRVDLNGAEKRARVES